MRHCALALALAGCSGGDLPPVYEPLAIVPPAGGTSDTALVVILRLDLTVAP